MTVLAPISAGVSDLPGLIDRAASMLAGAKSAAEVLEAREYAGLAYDAAKRASRLSRAKSAHDDLIAAAHRAQADALEIEAAAKRRLADEYDAAQARGEVAGLGTNQHSQQHSPSCRITFSAIHPVLLAKPRVDFIAVKHPVTPPQ